jgi:hypothetical protein
LLVDLPAAVAFGRAVLSFIVALLLRTAAAKK